MIYFIEAIGTNRVKIGLARSVAGRLRNLQSANAAELKVLRMYEGGLAEEAKFHELFATHRLKGEWFDAAEVEKTHARSTKRIAAIARIAHDDLPWRPKGTGIWISNGQLRRVEEHRQKTMKKIGGVEVTTEAVVERAIAAWLENREDS